MFCPNCGSEMNDTVAACSNCGYSRSNEAASKERNAKRKNVKWLLLTAALVVVAICLFANTGINKSAENVAIAAVESEYEVDIDKMVKVFPDFTIRELAADYGLSIDATRQQVANEIKKDYRFETPADIKIIDATVTREYNISEYTIFRELYDYMSEKDYDMISHVAKVEVRFYLDGEENSVTVTCIKMKNRWYLLRG